MESQIIYTDPDEKCTISVADPDLIEKYLNLLKVRKSIEDDIITSLHSGDNVL